MHKGVFTISLDFELHWGVFDKRNREEREPVYRNTLDLIPQLLDAFAQYQVGVTWASVGSLFCANEEEWRSVLPGVLPQYEQQKYSPYYFADTNGIGQNKSWAHFAPAMVKRIASYEGQELATHTFSHYYCLEKGQTPVAFRADLEVVQTMAERLTGKRLTSLVFPRNQYNQEYLAICGEAGITAIRSNPDTWFWTGIGNDNTSLMRRLFRTGDVFFPTGKRMSYPLASLPMKPGEPLAIPASRLLRQFDARFPMLNRRRIERIKAEMTAAAKIGECYHLWWHPENFGYHPRECMRELTEILEHYQTLQLEMGMLSATMGQLEIMRNQLTTTQTVQ